MCSQVMSFLLEVLTRYSRVLALSAVLFAGNGLVASHSVSGLVVDSSGRPLSDMSVELASGWGGLDPVFDEDALATRTNERGRFTLSPQWDMDVSFHVIAYSDDHFGELWEWAHLKRGTQDQDLTELCIVCGPRYTMSVEPVMPEDAVTEDARYMVVLRACTVASRVYVRTRSKDVAPAPMEFPCGGSNMDVLCLADPISKETPKDGEMATQGWKLRGEVKSARCGEPVRVALNDFDTGRSDDDGGLLTLKVPQREGPTHVIALSENDDVVWHESTDGFWRAHVESRPCRDAADRRVDNVIVCPGQGVSRLILWSKVDEVEYQLDLADADFGEWNVARWEPVKSNEGFAVSLPDQPRPRVQNGRRLTIIITKGPYFDIREATVDVSGVFSFNMPSLVDRVTVNVAYASPDDEEPVWTVAATRGETAQLPEVEFAQYLLNFKPPKSSSMGLSRFQLRQAQDEGESTTHPRLFWAQFGANGTTVIHLRPGVEYQIRIGDRWVSFRADRDATEIELDPWK